MTAAGRSRRIVVTGPVAGLERYAAAARAAGWEAIELPLVAVRPCAIDLADLDRAPDWVCITSANAIASLEPWRERLGGARCAVVGTHSVGALRELGLAVEIEGARDAAELSERLAPELSPEDLVLWPRSSLARELGERLAQTGARIEDPVAYETVERAEVGPLPAAEAVFLASPSAARAWLRRAAGTEPESMLFVIGPTTASTLEAEARQPDMRVRVLLEPTPAALASALRELG